MTERFDRLEAELAAMKPQRISAELAERISSDLSRAAQRSWSDRLLIAAMSAGGIAATVIATVLLIESQSMNGAPAPISAASIAHQQTAFGPPLVLARADANWP